MKLHITSLFLCTTLHVFGASFEHRMLKALSDQCKFSQEQVHDIEQSLHLANGKKKSIKKLPLFNAFAKLEDQLPYVSLGDLWTPITRCEKLADHLNIKNLFIKRDDLTGKTKGSTKLFGGNKVRKLEFLLGDAIAHNAQTVMTFGCAGSNHALATSVYCKELGLDCLCMLKKQWNGYTLRRNLLMQLDTGSKVFHAPSNDLRKNFALYQFVQTKQKTGKVPYVIPTGGSCPIGATGFVNAVLELKEQIAQGLMPEPDRMYVPTGSCGTSAGILLGLKAAGLKSKLIAVAVEPEEYKGQFAHDIISLATKTNAYLHELDGTFPLFEFDESSFEVVLECTGTDYALFTPEGMTARNMVKDLEGITLDGVYTAKGFSGLIKHAQEHKINPNEVVLFWNTYSSDDFKEITQKQNYKKLPKPFYVYFEEDVQELDRA